MTRLAGSVIVHTLPVAPQVPGYEKVVTRVFGSVIVERLLLPSYVNVTRLEFKSTIDVSNPVVPKFCFTPVLSVRVNVLSPFLISTEKSPGGVV